MKKKKQLNQTPLDPETLVEGILHFQYTKVVWAGKERPYEFNNLYRAPKDFCYKDYRDNNKEELDNLLEQGELGPFRCAKLVPWYYFLISILYGSTSVINSVLPLSLKVFMRWYDPEGEDGEFIHHPNFWKGMLSVALFGSLMILSALCQARGCEIKAKLSYTIYNIFGVKSFFNFSLVDCFLNLEFL